METVTHKINGCLIAEIVSDDIIITTKESGKDIIAEAYYNGFDSLVIHSKNITDVFFNLKTGIAGEILQQVSNFRMRLAIVGDFDKYNSQSLADYIRESNRTGQIIFMATLNDAISKMCGK